MLANLRNLATPNYTGSAFATTAASSLPTNGAKAMNAAVGATSYKCSAPRLRTWRDISA